MEREHTVNLKLTNGAECICNPEILLGTNYGLWDFENEVAPRGTLLDLNAAWELFLSRQDFDHDVTFREKYYHQHTVEDGISYDDGDTKYTLYDGDTPTKAFFVIKASKGPVEHIEWQDGNLILYYTKTRPMTQEDSDNEQNGLPIHYVLDENNNKVIDPETGNYLVYDYVVIPVVEIFDNDETHKLFPWFADDQHTVRLRQNIDNPNDPDDPNYLGDAAITSSSEIFIVKDPIKQNFNNTLISVQSLFDTIQRTLGTTFLTSEPDTSIVDAEGNSKHVRANGNNLYQRLQTDNVTSIVDAINSLQDFSKKLHELIDGHKDSVEDNHSLGLNIIFENNDAEDNIVKALNFIQASEIGNWPLVNNIRYYDEQTQQYVKPETISDAITLIFDKLKANTNKIGYDRTNHQWIPLTTSNSNGTLIEAINEVDNHVDELAARAGLIENNNKYSSENLNNITKNRITRVNQNDITLIQSINELQSQIGNLDSNRSLDNSTQLRTDAKNNLVEAINEVDTHADNNNSVLGATYTTDNSGVKNSDITNLTTDDKSTVVNAINELVTKVGPLEELPTDDQDSIVDAIKELESEMPIIYQDTDAKSTSGLIHRNLNNYAGQLSLVLGNNNSSGKKSFVYGTNNSSVNDYDLVSGLNNSLTGNYSQVFGYSNIVGNGDYQFVNGSENSVVRGSNNFIKGSNNELIDSNNIVIFGSRNEVNCQEVSIFGSDNIIEQNSNKIFIAGSSNSAFNPEYQGIDVGESVILGYHNIVGRNSVIIGQNNNSYSDNNNGYSNYIIGENNTIRNSFNFSGKNNIIIGFNQNFSGEYSTIIASDGLNIPQNKFISDVVIINGKNRQSDVSGNITEIINGATHIGQDIYIRTHNSQSKLQDLIAVDLNNWCRENASGLLSANYLFLDTSKVSEAIRTYVGHNYSDSAILRFKMLNNQNSENGFVLVQGNSIRVYLKDCWFYSNNSGQGWSRHDGEYLRIAEDASHNKYIAFMDQLSTTTSVNGSGAQKVNTPDFGSIDLTKPYGAMPVTDIYDSLNLQDKFNQKVDKTAQIITSYTDSNGLKNYVSQSFVNPGNPDSSNNITIDLKDNFGFDLNEIQFKSEKGQRGGYVPLNNQGKINSEYLPSFIDEVVDVWADYNKLPSGELANIQIFELVEQINPVTGEIERVKGTREYTDRNDGGSYITPETGKIYVEADTDGPMTVQFRWTGSQFVPIGYQNLVLGEVEGTAYEGSKGKAVSDGLQAHINNMNNPHNVQATQLEVTIEDPNSDHEDWTPVQNQENRYITDVYNALQELFNRLVQLEDYSNPVFSIIGTAQEIEDFDNLANDVDGVENPTIISELMSYNPIPSKKADEDSTLLVPGTNELANPSVERLVETYFNIEYVAN